jgi:DNA invertase Pin-like site-specific DNA recombinase
MLNRIAGNGVRVILIESPDRFARDLAVQLAGHDHLKRLGLALIPASAPDFFTEDTPTSVLVRQVLGAIAQFDKSTVVAKLKAARDRKREEIGKCGGRKSYAERDPDLVAKARELSERRPRLVVQIVGQRVWISDVPWSGFTRASHGRSVARDFSQKNGRSPRYATP